MFEGNPIFYIGEWIDWSLLYNVENRFSCLVMLIFYLGQLIGHLGESILRCVFLLLLWNMFLTVRINWPFFSDMGHRLVRVRNLFFHVLSVFWAIHLYFLFTNQPVTLLFLIFYTHITNTIYTLPVFQNLFLFLIPKSAFNYLFSAHLIKRLYSMQIVAINFNCTWDFVFSLSTSSLCGMQTLFVV
jgi:hypothetical protein